MNSTRCITQNKKLCRSYGNKNIEYRQSSLLNRSQILENTKFHSNKVNSKIGFTQNKTVVSKHQSKINSAYKSFINSHCMKRNQERNASLKNNSDTRKICNKSASYFKENKSRDLSQSKNLDFDDASFNHYQSNSKDNNEGLSERKRKQINQSYCGPKNDSKYIKNKKLLIQTDKHKSLYSEFNYSTCSRSKVRTPDKIVNSSISGCKNTKRNQNKLQKTQIMNKIPLSDRSESRSRVRSDIETLSECDINYHDNTSDVYQDKLISQFENILFENDLQSHHNLRFDDLKKILAEMNLISLDSNRKKWDVLITEVWKLLTLKKSSADYISIRSAKVFILGVCGIESQMIFEASEADSTPSASTGESKTNEEFIFASSEHLNSIRSKFYEMVLHKLTYAKDLKSSERIKKCKTECSKRLSKNYTKQNDKRNVSPVSQIQKSVKSSVSEQHKNNSEIVFKKSRYESPHNLHKRSSEIITSSNNDILKSNKTSSPHSKFKSDDLKDICECSELEFSPIHRNTSNADNIPIINFNVHIGNGVKKELNIYNSNTFYKEAEDFCKLYNIPEQKQELLINIIKDGLQNSLTRIDEVEEESEIH